MNRKIFFALLMLLLVKTAAAEEDSLAKANVSRSRLRISLLTCGVGEEVYEIFGHTAVRVIDSNIAGPLGDLVYNYGMFNGFDENFEMKFMQGKLLYYVATNYYPDFMMEYTDYGRSVEEQVLQIGTAQKEEINAFLQENILPQNKYYKYDFFYDNCATRIRDIFPRTLGAGFTYGNVLHEGARLTFRDIINQYFYAKHWERVGVNILLGSRIDKVMTNSEIMFLPDYLRDGIRGAKLDGRDVATPPELLLEGNKQPSAALNLPMLLMCSLLLLTIIGLGVKQMRILGRIMSAFLLLLSGLLGTLILVMWFGTNHQGCGNNFNVLWALPLNAFIAFAKPVKKDRYAALAMILIVVSLLLHVLHIQAIVPELLPLLLSLLLIHGSIYRRSKMKIVATDEK
jgi:hypothetical protein